MKISSILFGLIALCCVSCDGLREKDRSRLAEAANNGDVIAMKAIYGFKNMCCDKPFVDEQTYNSFNQVLMEQGYHKVWLDKINAAKAAGADKSELVEMSTEAAEHGCVPCMDDLAKYYHDMGTPESNEKAMFWTQKAAEQSCALAQMRLLRWQDKSIYMPTRAIKVGKEGWNVVEEGTILAKLTSWTVWFVSTYFVDIFKFTFSKTTWWQGLLGLLFFILFVSGIGFFPSFCKDAIDDRATLPIYWTLLYGGINGLVIVINTFDGFVTGNWIKGENFVSLNIGRLTYAPYSCTFVSDICIYATWIWLIGVIGIFLYLYFSGVIKDKGKFAFVLFATMMAYIYGAALSLLSIVLAVICVLMIVAAMPAGGGSSSSSDSSSSSSSSNEEDWKFTVTDEFGGTRKLKEDGFGYKDDEGRRWKNDGFNTVVRDD
jgi:hypothetical protein